MNESDKITSLNINEILKHQRNRYPVLLIDRIMN